MTASPAVHTMTSLLPLASILPHPLNLAHVEAPMESITVDSQGVLLAGSHRREAIKRLQSANPEAFTEHFSAGVPVRSHDFDSAYS
jgi:ParB family transcriptional regulator, chromosome partitioning protein